MMSRDPPKFCNFNVLEVPAHDGNFEYLLGANQPAQRVLGNCDSGHRTRPRADEAA
jgi:hypothetical protein